MKKIIRYILIIMVISIGIVGCGKKENKENKKDIKEKKVEADDGKFSEEDMKKAIDVLKAEASKIEGLNVEIVEYRVAEQKELEEYSIKYNISLDNIMILRTELTTADVDTTLGFEPNKKIKNYEWLLIKDYDSMNWKVVEKGI